MIKCGNCGKELLDNSKFCAYCGVKQEAAPETPKTPIKPEAVPKAETSGQKPRNKPAMFICLALAAIATIALVFTLVIPALLSEVQAPASVSTAGSAPGTDESTSTPEPSGNVQPSGLSADNGLEDIEKANETLAEMRTNEEYSAGLEAERMLFARSVLDGLSEEGLVDGDTIYQDDEKGYITYCYSSGALGIETVREEDPELGGGQGPQSDLQARLALPQPAAAFAAQDGDIPDAQILLAWDEYVTGKKYEQFYSATDDMTDIWREWGMRVGNDPMVTLDDLTHLGGNELIYIAMHGQYAHWNISLTSSINTPLIALKQKENSVSSKQFSDDLRQHRVGIRNGYYFILPSFFSHHYASGGLKDSIIFFGCCELMGKDGNVAEDMTAALEGASVEAFIAMHNEAYIKYHLLLLYKISEELVEGQTIKAALDSAMDDFGKDDLYWMEIIEKGVCPADHLPAYPLLRGNEDAKLKYYENLSFIGDEEAPSTSVSPVQPEATLPELPGSFIFASGIGAWSTMVDIKQDGTFSGYYHDTNMGDIGEGYPNGSIDECYFSGSFKDIRKISDYEYSMRIDSFSTEGTKGEEKIVDGVRHFTAEPYGFDGTDEYRLYLPGIETADLPEAYMEWIISPMAWYEDIPETLPFYGLYSLTPQYAFFYSEEYEW